MYYGCCLADYSDSLIFNELIYFIFYLSILYDYIYIQSAHGYMRRLSNPVTFLSLSQARTWVSNAISGNLFLCSVVWGERLFCFVDFGGIVDQHSLNFLFIHYCPSNLMKQSQMVSNKMSCPVIRFQWIFCDIHEVRKT